MRITKKHKKLDKIRLDDEMTWSADVSSLSRLLIIQNSNFEYKDYGPDSFD